MSRALIVTRRELVDMLRDWRILFPIIILSGVFPFIANWGAERLLNFVQQYGADIVGERLIPFLLLVVGFFPTSFSLIIALESFAGEKERRSLEPLLNSPLTDLQLYLGKMMASTIAPIFASLVGITVYLVSVFFNVSYVAPPILLILIFLLTSVQAIMMVAAAVVVSSLSTSVRAANLLASFIIVPVAFLLQLEAFLMFWARYNTLWLILIGMVLITIVLVRMGLNAFNREALLGTDIDEIDLGRSIGNIVRRVIARTQDGTRNAWQWYRQEVLAHLPKLLLPALVVLIFIGASLYIGLDYAARFPITADVANLDDWAETFPAIMGEFGLVGISGVGAVIVQNLRVLIVGLLLGIFTLGVAMLLLVMAPFAIIGFVFAQVINLGLDPALVYAAVLPHGVFEIPAVILAGATVLRLGGVLIAPTGRRSLGEVWTETLANVLRMWGVLILPLLIIVAVVEVFITPQIVLAVVGG
jgi:uncharacterized membrane protein SpoIIM required for sporulation